MNRIHDFIKQGISSFFSQYPNNDLYNCCTKLNNLLNPVSQVVYIDFLKNNELAVDKEVENLFTYIYEGLYLYLPDFFCMLKTYQECCYIEGEYYRDHYYHSIQCFLLALSLYPKYRTICVPDKPSVNVICKLFTITIYHDLGYLYKTKLSNVSVSLKRRFESLQLNDDIGIQQIIKMLRLENITNEELKIAVNGEELTSLWSDLINGNDRLFLQDKLKLANLGSDYAKHHSYESAVLLDRLVRSKSLIRSNLQSRTLQKNLIDISSDIVQADEEKDFLDSMKSIIMHDYGLTSPLSFSESFWGCFLMIVDELQEYGRPYQDERNNPKIINPYNVGVDITEDKLTLLIDDQLSEKELKYYKEKFSKKRIYKSLKEKIKETELNKIFI